MAAIILLILFAVNLLIDLLFGDLVYLYRGCHYGFPFRVSIFSNRTRFSWIVQFDKSAIYDLGDSDQQDINKLFGITYGFLGVHKHSARFGWNYNLELNCIDIFGYVYADGQRLMHYIGSVQTGENIYLQLSVTHLAYEFRVVTPSNSCKQIPSTRIPKGNPKVTYGRYTYPYFGGNKKAPHTICISFRKR